MGKGFPDLISTPHDKQLDHREKRRQIIPVYASTAPEGSRKSELLTTKSKELLLTARSKATRSFVVSVMGGGLMTRRTIDRARLELRVPRSRWQLGLHGHLWVSIPFPMPVSLSKEP